MQTSQVSVIVVTAAVVVRFQNADRSKEGSMPILMVALIALAAFGLIGLMLVLAVTLEQKKTAPKEPPAGKVA